MEVGNMRNKSSDNKSAGNMMESSIPGESNLTQIEPLNNKQKNGACSSIHKSKNRGDTPSNFEDETMRDAPSNIEDEAMRNESSQDGGSDDTDRPSAREDELRLAQVEAPNNILGSRGWSAYDECEDPFSKVQSKNDTSESTNNEDVSRSTQTKLKINSKSEYGKIDGTREDMMIHGEVTDHKEYLDDVTYCLTSDAKKDTSLTSGNFIDTNRLLKKFELKNTLPSAHETPP